MAINGGFPETDMARLTRYANALRVMLNKREEYVRLGVLTLAEMEGNAIRRMQSVIKAEEMRLGMKAG
jgi:hypothetical protein